MHLDRGRWVLESNEDERLIFPNNGAGGVEHAPIWRA